jgi:beta-lactam-binding protein with PASTA domain
MQFKRINFNVNRLKIDVNRFKPTDPDTSRFIIVACVVVVLFMGLSALVAFFVALRGAEKTMVPDLRGMELSTALVAMQEKELYPRIQLRNSDSVDDSGTILEQNPGPGAIVKAGRRINIVVSRGLVVKKVDNYVGQRLEEVKIHLQTLFTNTANPLLSIQDPPVAVFNPKEPGTILEQQPLPGTAITKPVKLVLVVSRGPEKKTVTVPSLMGLGLKPALEAIDKAGVTATFSSRKREGTEAPLSISSQLPAAGSSVPASTLVSLVITEPDKKDGYSFGIFKQSLPDYPYALRLTVVAELPSGSIETLFDQNHPGGAFSLPYYLPTGSQVVLKILGQEKFRQSVEAGQ